MRAIRPIRVLVLLLAASLLPTMVALASHAPTVEDVVAEAQGLGMTCVTAATEVDCSGPPASAFRNPLTIVKPATGPLTEVYTRVDAHTNGIHDFLVEDRAWFTTLHNVSCANGPAVASFMDALAAQFAQSQTGGTYGPFVVGECSMVGSLVTALTRIAYWEVTSRTLPSAFPTLTPSPSPTPTPTPVPTTAPTATPMPTATPSATPGATSTATPTAIPATSESGSASASGSASESQSASETASATAEQSVAGLTFSPEPSVPQQAPEEGDDWAGSVPGAGDVSTDVGKVGGSAMAALLMLVAMGYIGELFNNTMEANYDRMLTWWKKSWVGRIGRGLGGLFGGGS